MSSNKKMTAEVIGNCAVASNNQVVNGTDDEKNGGKVVIEKMRAICRRRSLWRSWISLTPPHRLHHSWRARQGNLQAGSPNEAIQDEASGAERGNSTGVFGFIIPNDVEAVQTTNCDGEPDDCVFCAAAMLRY